MLFRCDYLSDEDRKKLDEAYKKSSKTKKEVKGIVPSVKDDTEK